MVFTILIYLVKKGQKLFGRFPESMDVYWSYVEVYNKIGQNPVEYFFYNMLKKNGKFCVSQEKKL